ncbi:hypothetical protein FACS189452_06440 [Bacteroidia bacterium]|nr:hypothetical protein FACS189452_06440 [Bacteroidia bacterium]
MNNNKPTTISVLPMVRIDRNIVHNIDGLFDLFNITSENIDDNLLRNVIYYLCYNYQKDLFSYSTFDPYDFAKIMGYSTVYLRKKHPKPLFMKDFKKMPKSKQQEHLENGLPCYDNNIENALYLLWKKEVLFSYGAKFYNKTDHEEVITAHQNKRMLIVRDLNVLTIKSGKTKQLKTVYSLELDDKFLHSLTKYFVRSKVNALIELRKCKLDMLYLKLAQQKDHAIYSKQSEVVFDNFETLCKWCCISPTKKDGTDVPPKKRKQLVLEALRKVNEKTDLNYTISATCSRGQKFPYTILLHFILDEAVITDKKKSDKKDMMYLFDETLRRDLVSFYKMYVCSGQNPLTISPQGFYNWLCSDSDYEEKKRVYLLVASKIFGKETDLQKRMLAREKNFDAFYKECITNKTIAIRCTSEDIENVLSTNNDL